MSSKVTLINPNKLVSDNCDILNTFTDTLSLLVLHFLYKRGPSTAEQISKELDYPLPKFKMIISLLEKRGLIKKTENIIYLTEIANNRLNYSAVSLEFLVGTTISSVSNSENPLAYKYLLKKVIGRGSTSFTFLAEQSGTHKKHALKIFLPNMIAYELIDKALEKLHTIESNDYALPDVLDAGQVGINLPDQRQIIVPCIVLKYINSRSTTFSEFLESYQNFSSEIFERFVQRVGSALRAIEDIGLIHGDLHEGNILVVPAQLTQGVAVDFWVIDYIGTPSFCSPEFQLNTDLENFKNHLLKAAIKAAELYPGYSLRHILGDNVFRVLNGMRKNEYKNFADLFEDFGRKSNVVPENYFTSPVISPFEWLRADHLKDPELLYTLFEPDNARFKVISRFGNTWISGPRGCGKSHYLLALAFHPSVLVKAETDLTLNNKLETLNNNFKRAFGILFRCRLGEFKVFTPEAIGKKEFDLSTKKILKHILILKIINKTLIEIKNGIETRYSSGKSVIILPKDIKELFEFLNKKHGSMAIAKKTDLSAKEYLFQCIDMCIAQENYNIANWTNPKSNSNEKLLKENDLDDFFTIIKRTFSNISSTKFYILVDDASHDFLHYELQKILNSLIYTAQSNHCFKITSEKFKYTLDTSDGHPLDLRQDGTYVDLGETTTKAIQETAKISEYTARIINRRLSIAGYRETIQTILGKSQKPTDFLQALCMPRRKKKNDGIQHLKAYYAGWSMVSSLSHGSIRTLLELVEHIFNENNVKENTEFIPLKKQDSAVRNYSNRLYKSLDMIPGEYKERPLGPMLMQIISAVGKVSRLYLEKYDTGQSGRWYETISFERTDTDELEKEATFLLEELVKYGLLVDRGLNFSRSQFGLCIRYDMNKIFAPAFQTTYRVRNHLFLKKGLLEKLLLTPNRFVGNRNKLFNKNADEKNGQYQLRFDFLENGDGNE